jgi:putative phosphoribosyl transferase
MPYTRFRDRLDAGRQLAARLTHYAHRPDVLVLALPRGGVPVAFEVARTLGAPLDIFLVRKLGVPDHEELAMGAIASGGVRVINPDVVQTLQIPPDEIDRIAEQEQRELLRREHDYRGGRAPPEVRGKAVILIDDGLATGASMRAAAAALRRMDPGKLIAAVPTGAAETCDELAGQVDEMVCVMTPQPFHAVGLWYERFDQTSDQEVRDLLEAARHHESPA